ncbi:MAG: hypothetical protein NC081_00130 [Roseburia sp.]|nr:hypothetical protein [Roseburia sp.]
MKKLAVTVLLAATLMLAACGDNKQSDSPSATRTTPEVSTEADAQEDTQGTDTDEADTKEADSDESGAGEKTTQEAADYSLGEFTETGYQSSYMGYQFTTPEGCILATEEELAQMGGMSAEILEDDFGKAMAEYAKNSVVFDLYAIFPETNTNINMTLSPNTMNITDISLVVEASVEQLEAMQTMEVTVSDERSTVQIAGKDYLSFIADTRYNDANYGEIAIKQECYMTLYNDKIVSMAISYQEGNESERDALLAAFSEF